MKNFMYATFRFVDVPTRKCLLQGFYYFLGFYRLNDGLFQTKHSISFNSWINLGSFVSVFYDWEMSAHSRSREWSGASLNWIVFSSVRIIMTGPGWACAIRWPVSLIHTRWPVTASTTDPTCWHLLSLLYLYCLVMFSYLCPFHRKIPSFQL